MNLKYEDLTHHQDIKLEEIIKHLRTGAKRIVLQGSAGVGKTTLIKFIVDHEKLLYINKVTCAAPTNKAVSVIRSKMEGSDIHFVTVHKGLGLRMKNDYKERKKTFIQDLNGKKPFFGCDLLIIDEASMLSQELFDRYLDQLDTPIIFVGDDKQLNPVNEKKSIVFHKGYPTVTLTQIIRQAANNPIIKLSRNLENLVNPIEEIYNHQGYFFSKDKTKIIEALAEANGTDDYKYLAWTNNVVDAMNRKVREKIYNNPSLIEQGETLIFNEPFGKYWINQELKVEKVEIVVQKMLIFQTNNIKRERYIQYYLINNEIPVVHEKSWKEYNIQKRDLYLQCDTENVDWEDYEFFINRFAYMKYNHALTVHKSQGSTYKKVVLNVKNIMLNKRTEERERLLYTGVTRASDVLIIQN